MILNTPPLDPGLTEILEQEIGGGGGVVGVWVLVGDGSIGGGSIGGGSIGGGSIGGGSVGGSGTEVLGGRGTEVFVG